MYNQAIVLHAEDTVATALSDLRAGETIQVQVGARIATVTVAEAVPFGHKVAIVAMPAGSTIRKYGESIGSARVEIPAGGYVHVHNVESQRGRGDRAEGKGGTK